METHHQFTIDASVVYLAVKFMATQKWHFYILDPFLIMDRPYLCELGLILAIL